ncbi:MAG: bifunctional glutamate N-acetyltransferase/amino-acid acetyltransferase ArgJ [Burkholderiales bacterium]|jgi:glutamate N-acetyltransferase/amino-acid N-acetyltransferase|nr:bifunctional glutamate N-acetyltransferase/amino-acid acetyltransferase ArgJ [Burkholderiales bacterium]
MSVRYQPASAESILTVSGIRLGTASARIKNWERDDVLLIECEEGTIAAAVFTQNRFCAAPVLLDKEYLTLQRQYGKGLRGIIVNAGNANAGTGAEGFARAKQTSEEVARILLCAPEEVMVCSTGVIMEQLPVEKLIAVLPQAASRLDASSESWIRAARAIMTTDTVHKAISTQVIIDGEPVTVTGIAKGAGMIHPNMATMLSFIASDVPIAADVWQALWRDVVGVSFNAITIDGDTSTNDSLIAMATGQAKVPPIKNQHDPRLVLLKEALLDVALPLAQAIIRDGEGASKFITIHVEGHDVETCRKVAFSVAHSPLVKTAFFASDPNLGRIICAIGNATPEDLDAGRVSLWLGDVLVVDKGGRASSYREEDGQRVMQEEEIDIRIDLGHETHQNAKITIWTCDLSHDYVTINAEYRT